MRLFLILFSFFIQNHLFSYEQSLTDEATKGKLESARLDEMIEKYLATISMYDPERATYLGIHDNDYLLTSRDYATQGSLLDAIRFLKKDIERIDYESLDVFKRSEYNTLSSMIENDIYGIENIKRLSLYPQYYLEPFDTVYFMMTKDYAPYMARAKNALARLSKIPSILYQAERNITRPPRPWTVYSINRASYTIVNLGDYYQVFRNYIGLDPTLKTEFENIISDLKTALERYKRFLEKEVLPRSDGKAYSGLYTYGFYLERWHGIDYNPRKAMRVAKRNFMKNYARLVEEAKKIAPDRYSEGGIAAVYQFISGDYPEYDNVVKNISDLFEKAKDHFDEYRVIKYPQQRLLIRTSPVFFTGFYPSFFYIPPFALDKERVGEIYIYLPNEKDKEKQEKILSSLYSQPKIELFISSLLIPGLHIRYDYLGGLSKIRKVAYHPALDGWMDFAIDLAMDMGYYSSVYAPFLTQYFKTLRALRGYLDVAYHIEEINWDEAKEKFNKYFGLNNDMCEYEMLNISMKPSYFFAAVYGYNEIVKLKNKFVGSENRFFDLREFNSDFLTRGNISFKDIKEELKVIRKERLKKKILEEEEYEE
ncbi:MAG: DUF885 family protein [Elusimicrobiales bacterium]